MSPEIQILVHLGKNFDLKEYVGLTLEGNLKQGLLYSRATTAGKAPRPGPCLDLGFQYALIRNNRSKEFGVEYFFLASVLFFS